MYISPVKITLILAVSQDSYRKVCQSLKTLTKS
jgi:hypothetical protein